MAKSVQKITLSQSRDIPFNKLVLSQSNVRRIKAGVSIEELAQDIARRTLLQSLTVRPVLDDDGSETGMFEVPAGGRRYRALELLVQHAEPRAARPARRRKAGARGRRDPRSRVGNGWKLRSTFPTATPLGCANISGEPVAMTDEEIARLKRCGASMIVSSKPTQKPTNSPKRSINALEKSRRLLRRSTNGRSSMIPTRSRAPASSSSIDGSGALRIERGYIRPEDEPAIPEAQPRATRNRAASKAPVRMRLRPGMAVRRHRRSVRKRRSRASSRSLIG